MGITGGEKGANVWLTVEELESLILETNSLSAFSSQKFPTGLNEKLKRKLGWATHLDRLSDRR